MSKEQIPDKFLIALDKEIKRHSFDNSDNKPYWKYTTTECLDKLRRIYKKQLKTNP